MGLERLAGIVLVVLRDDRQRHAASVERPHVLLEGDERLATRSVPELDPRQPVLGDHATPEGVIEIEHEALGAEPLGSREHRGGVTGERGQRVERNSLLGHEPVAVVEPARLPIRAGKTVAVDHHDPVAGCARQPRVQRSQQLVPGPRHPARNVPPSRVGPQHEVVLDDPSRASSHRSHPKARSTARARR